MNVNWLEVKYKLVGETYIRNYPPAPADWESPSSLEVVKKTLYKGIILNDTPIVMEDGVYLLILLPNGRLRYIDTNALTVTEESP